MNHIAVSRKVVGDNITVGKHTILVVGREHGYRGEALAEPSDLDETRVLDTTRQRELLAKQNEAAEDVRALEG